MTLIFRFGLPILIALTSLNIWSQESDLNFYEACEAFYNLHEGKDITKVEGFKQFKRWEYFNERRCYPTGTPPHPAILWDEWQKTQLKSNKSSGNWTIIGPDTIPNIGGGMGRINCIQFDPINSNIVWAGAPNGGLWKSNNGGINWTTNTNQLPNLGVSAIAISPTNPDTMYIATGDGHAINMSTLWGGTYSNGILKSTDGGQTWNSTGMNYSLTQARQIHDLSISQHSPNMLLAATSNGLWKSSDAAMTWTQVAPGKFKDIEFHVSNPNIVYATSENVYKSIDGGDSWSVSTTVGAPGTAVDIAVTEANPSVIYYMSEYGQLAKSNDEGLTWETPLPLGNTYYSWYAMTLEVSQIDENLLFTGGMDLYKSIDGGANWLFSSMWNAWPADYYSHADHRVLAFVPGSNNEILNGNDGGVFKSSDQGVSWVDLSNDLTITQLYKIGGNPLNSDIIFAGAQDNGVIRKTSGSWDQVLFADGMEVVVDYINPNNIFACMQQGFLYVSHDGGNTFSNGSPNVNADWVAPLALHPNNPTALYYGGEDLMVLNQNGSAVNNLTNGITNGEFITSISIAKNDPNIICFTSGSKLYGGVADVYRTENGGTTWSSVSSGTPVNLAYVTQVEMDPNDPDILYTTFSGYESGEKIYQSYNGGISWTNISGSLPNIPINCIVAQDSPDHRIYVGTDFGVYYLNDSLPDWTAFSNGLPNVIISELEIHEQSNKIRAATYGRGVWESELDIIDNTNINENIELDMDIYPNPSNGKLQITGKFEQIKNGELTIFNLLGQTIYFQKLNQPNTPLTIDLSNKQNGQYIVQIKADNLLQVRRFSIKK